MVNAFGIFNFYVKNNRTFHASTTLGTLDHFSHSTLFEFLKKFAQKTQKSEIKTYFKFYHNNMAIMHSYQTEEYIYFIHLQKFALNSVFVSELLLFSIY